MLSEFVNVFERKFWRIEVAHFKNAARALSSPSRCFQLSTNLGKDFFRYLWYCGKKSNQKWFSVALVKFHWFGIYWHVFNQPECRNCCSSWCCYSENRATSQVMATFWACACKLFWTPFSAARVQPLMPDFKLRRTRYESANYGISTIDPRSQKEHTEIHRIPKFGVNQSSFDCDKAI